MRKLLVVFLSVIVMTFGLVGCGGGSSSSNTSQHNSITKVPAQEGLPAVPTIPETK